MSRTIPDCPNAPVIQAGEQHPNTITKIYTITVMTPLFGGGVEAGINDPVTLIRPSSIRGHLRFWWRATRGARCGNVKELRQREGEIWGTTDNPSPVTIQVEASQWSQKREPSNYYGFSRYGAEAYALFSAQQNSNQLCKEGLSFSLTLRWPTLTKLQALRHQENEQRRKTNNPLLPEKIQHISLDIEAAVWAWINFGGIGARTRRGCGALFCLKVQPETPAFHPPSIADFPQWFKRKVEQYEFPLLTSPIHRAWPTFPSTICLKQGAKDGQSPTLSVGIAIAHSLDPLEDLLSHARAAERAAKNDAPQRNGLAVHLHPRSGAPIRLRTQWTADANALDTRLERWANLHLANLIPDKAAYDLRELIRDYDGWPTEDDSQRHTLVEALRRDAIQMLKRKRGRKGDEGLDKMEALLQGVESLADARRVAEEMLVARRIAEVRRHAEGTPQAGPAS